MERSQSLSIARVLTQAGSLLRERIRSLVILGVVSVVVSTLFAYSFIAVIAFIFAKTEFFRIEGKDFQVLTTVLAISTALVFLVEMILIFAFFYAVLIDDMVRKRTMGTALANTLGRMRVIVKTFFLVVGIMTGVAIIAVALFRFFPIGGAVFATGAGVAVLVLIFWSLFTPFVVVVEGRSGWAAIRRSRELVRGRSFMVLGISVLWLVTVGMVSWSLDQIPYIGTSVGSFLFIMTGAPFFYALYGALCGVRGEAGVPADGDGHTRTLSLRATSALIVLFILLASPTIFIPVRYFSAAQSSGIDLRFIDHSVPFAEAVRVLPAREGNGADDLIKLENLFQSKFKGAPEENIRIGTPELSLLAAIAEKKIFSLYPQYVRRIERLDDYNQSDTSHSWNTMRAFARRADSYANELIRANDAEGARIIYENLIVLGRKIRSQRIQITDFLTSIAIEQLGAEGFRKISLLRHDGAALERWDAYLLVIDDMRKYWSAKAISVSVFQDFGEAINPYAYGHLRAAEDIALHDPDPTWRSEAVLSLWFYSLNFPPTNFMKARTARETLRRVASSDADEAIRKTAASILAELNVPLAESIQKSWGFGGVVFGPLPRGD